MHDLQRIARLHVDPWVLTPRDDFSIALDRDRAVGEPEVFDQGGERQPWRNFLDFTVDGQAHALYVGASL